MKSSNVTALVLFVGFATMGFVACGSDSSDDADVAGTGGATNATVGGSTSTNTTTRGGANTASGGSSVSRGGAATTGNGGRGNGLGGAATAGVPAIDLSCMQGGDCTAACSAACFGSTTTNYSCTCTNGQLSCDMTACTAAISGGECPSGTEDGGTCDSATATTCTPTSGGTLCFCSRQSNEWTCF
jgi:hypothetical protein